MAQDTPVSGRPPLLRRLALATLMTIVGLNVWTGSPLLALWVGSRMQGSGPATMRAIAVVAGVMIVVSLVLFKLLAILGNAYDDLVGRGPTVRAHAPWLRSMRGERPQYEGERIQLTALERVVVGTVVLATISFEVWFFFLSGSSIGQN